MALAIRNTRVISRESMWDETLQSITEELLCWENLEDSAWQLKKMSEIYKDALRGTETNAVPLKSELLEGLFEYNMERIHELAYMDYEIRSSQEFYTEALERAENTALSWPLNDPDERSQAIIDELYSIWIDDFHHMINVSQESYVETVMEELGFSYIDDLNFYHHQTQLIDHTILINDCQHFLLEDFHFAGFGVNPRTESMDVLNYLYTAQVVDRV